MKAMVLEKPGQPLTLVQRPDPQPGPGQVQVAIPPAAYAAPTCTWWMVI